MNAIARFFRFMLAKGLLLGTGLIAWALWRSFWPGDLWAEVVGLVLLVFWLVLVWLTTISRYIRLYGSLSFSRCLWLGAGMAFTAIVLFSSFLLVQLDPQLPSAPHLDLTATPVFSTDGFLLIVFSIICTTILVGALYWKSINWEDPSQMDY